MNDCRRMPRRACGLVLLELLIAVAVLAVLAAVAVPSFAALSERMKLRTAVDALTSSLYAARAEAYKRGGHVTVARNTGAAGCEAGGGPARWDCGWTVFADADEDGTRDPGDEPILSGQPPPGIHVTQSSGRAALKLNAWGQFSGLTGLRFVVQSGTSASVVSAVCISSGGRVQAWTGVDRCPS